MNDLSGIRFGPEIAGAARAHRLDPILLAAVAAQETGGPGSDSGRNVTGDGGHGHGLFQIDDRYHAFAGTPAAADPARNADYAAGMLKGLLDRYGGDAHRALSAYNAGSPAAQGTVTAWGDGRALGYADSVLRHYSGIAGRTEAREALVAGRPDDAASANALSDAYAARLEVVPSTPPQQAAPSASSVAISSAAAAALSSTVLSSPVATSLPASSYPSFVPTLPSPLQNGATATPASNGASGNATSPQQPDGSGQSADRRLAALVNPLDDDEAAEGG